MLNQAIKKLKAEMEKDSNSYVQVVGGFLLQHLQSNPESAEKILADDKSIAKSLDAMRKAAEKKKVGSCAVLTDQEGFEIVLKYFGIEHAKIAPSVELTPPAQKAEGPSIVDFDIRLEDLL
ncbi:MAG TPA: hypothetical protein DER33_10420 [Syntrophomonas sp.]|jgi:hypothetical protein|nr:hypothetical protein [Syntrophomonas sp.]